MYKIIESVGLLPGDTFSMLVGEGFVHEGDRLFLIITKSIQFHKRTK